ncbi:hypothetical protein JCM11641_006319 [Rhodosporidiobolus odoratus]
MASASILRPATRSSTSTGPLLDVFAPAVYGISTVPARRLSTAAAQAEALSAPSTSSPSTSSSSGPRTRKADHPSRPPSISLKPRSTPRSTPRQGRNRPPLLRAEPSAVDLLSRIRKLAPSSGSSPSEAQSALDAHNSAVLSLNRGIRDLKKPNYQHAFQQGWLPLRKKGQVGRLPSEDVAKVLRVVTATMRENPDRLRLDWKWWKELILWVSGEAQEVKACVADWAWEAVAVGPSGCERVVEIFEALGREQDKAIRVAENSPDFASKRDRPFAPQAEEDEPKLTTWLFAAAVASKTILRARQPQPAEPFSTLFPAYLDRSLPKLSSFLEHFNFLHRLNKSLNANSAYTDMPDALALSLASIRQVALAQRWYIRRDLPAVGVWRLASAYFRSGEHDRAWELWKSIQDAVDNPELGWLSVERWDASAKERWISKEVREQIERYERPFEGAEEEEGVHANLPLPPSEPSSSADPTPPLPPAILHQSIVAKFLSGFAYSRQFEHAEAIWNWLSSHSPPLIPGIVCWTGLLNGYARRGDVAAVEQVFDDMKAAQVEPDLWAWLDRIAAHFEARLPDEAMQLVKSMRSSQSVQRYVDKEYGGKLPEPAYNAIIVGLLANGKRAEAEALLEDMTKQGTPPSTYTVNGFIKHYSRGSKPDLAAVARLIKLVTDQGLEANVYTFTMVLKALLEAKQKDATAKTIAIMEASNVKPTVTTYGAIIASLTRDGKYEHLKAAVELLDEMENKKMPTNEIVYTTLIQGFLRGMLFVPTSPPSPLPSDESSATTTPAAAKSSRLPPISGSPASHPYLAAALTLKDRMQHRNLPLRRVGYNALISSALDLQHEAGTQLALSLFKEMRHRLRSSSGSPASTTLGESEQDSSGRQVTVADTWYILLQGFARMHDWQRAHAIVTEMEKNKFEVRSKGLKKLVRHVARREYQYLA